MLPGFSRTALLGSEWPDRMKTPFARVSLQASRRGKSRRRRARSAPLSSRGIAGNRTLEALSKIPVVRFAGNVLLFFAAQQSAVAVAHPLHAILEVTVVMGFGGLLFLIGSEL